MYKLQIGCNLFFIPVEIMVTELELGVYEEFQSFI